MFGTLTNGGYANRPNTLTDWITFLEGKLSSRQHNVRHYQTYYDADEQVLAFAQQKFFNEFGPMFQGWRDNFCSLVVDSISERLEIQGFRMTEDSGADKDANEIWQKNGLDSLSNSAHISALVAGEAFAIVWPGDDGEPVISIESAEEVYVYYRPGSQRIAQAAIKKFYDDWGTEYVTIWTPEQVATSYREEGDKLWTAPTVSPNPLGVVPVVKLSNRKRLQGNGLGPRHDRPFSELHPIIPIQDAITKISADAIVASEFAAYPQRIITGLEFSEDKNGDAVSPIQSAIDRMILLEGDGINFGQFSAADLNNYVNMINMLVQHISTISRVPPHYFLINGGQSPSGESIQSAEAGLVAKARERMLHFGEGWEEVMRLAFKVKNDPRADAFNAEVIWRDPERKSLAVATDSAVKLVQARIISSRQAAEDLGYSPTLIERMGGEIEEEKKAAMEEQRAMADITGAMGGSAPAGNGAKAADKQAPGNRNNMARKRNEAK
jgi:hypothetical protein